MARRRQPAHRCIALGVDGRCPHAAVKRNGDLFVCTRHGLIEMALIDDMVQPKTRHMLARARWETRAEGQWLINREAVR